LKEDTLKQRLLLEDVRVLLDSQEQYSEVRGSTGKHFYKVGTAQGGIRTRATAKVLCLTILENRRLEGYLQNIFEQEQKA
jgi:hypothetical protein